LQRFNFCASFVAVYILTWAGSSLSRHSDWLRTGRSGDRIPENVLYINCVNDMVLAENKNGVKIFRWGCDFPHLSRPALGPTQPPVQTGPGAHPASCTMGTGSFAGVKRPGRGTDHPPASSAEVTKG
jgi:hypothetical protein